MSIALMLPWSLAKLFFRHVRIWQDPAPEAPLAPVRWFCLPDTDSQSRYREPRLSPDGAGTPALSFSRYFP